MSLSADKPNVNLDAPATSEPDSPRAAPAGLSANSAPGSASKPQRVLACLLCQQRKIKCDRKFPCAHCARAGTKCVPAGLVPRQRRRRFPERELLDRIRNYEELLRQNNVAFEPLHPPAHPAEPAGNLFSQSADASSSATGPSEAGQQRSGAKPRPANLWHAMCQKVKGNPSEDDGDVEGESDEETDGGFQKYDDDLGDAVIKNAWTHTYEGAQEHNQHLLFGSPASTNHVSLTSSHPAQAGIFRLWQIYLENVDPLLKITHTPTLQARIVDALGDLGAITPPFEALLFAIYCVSIMSIADDQCQILFGSLKLDLLASYQFACRQALVNCQFLQCDEHDCLAALYLYLLTIKPTSDPRALSSMLAVAVRIAQRLGYHSEASNAKCNALEAELHRRLWWSLIIYDNRVCETFHIKTATLGPTWDCGVPRNLSDFELRSESRVLPPTSDKPTEALFVVMRSELSDFLRHTAFHTDFIDPLLTTFAHAKKTAHNAPPSSHRDLPELQRDMEERLKLCDMGNPLHFLTVWTTRGILAKDFLLEHCWRDSTSPTQQATRAQGNVVIPYALEMLDCDTRIMSSPLTKGFQWFTEFQFPFPAYTYILHRMKKWPEAAEGYAEQAWRAMSDNYEARGMVTYQVMHKPFYIVLSRMVLLAWEACEKMIHRSGSNKSPDPPRIVVDIRSKLPALPGRESGGDLGSPGGMPVTLSETPATLPVGVAESGTTAAGRMPLAAPGMPAGYEDMTEPAMLENMLGMGQLWPAMTWGMPHPRPW